MNFGTEKSHAIDIGLLALNVLGPHEDLAGHAEQRARGRGRHTMLTGTGLGDDVLLAHPLGQQRLTHHIVDLVGAGVVQLVALEVQLGAAEMLRQPLREIERARSADIVGVKVLDILLELRIGLGMDIRGLDLENQWHQGFRDIAAPEDAEVAFGVGAGTQRVRNGGDRHRADLQGLVSPGQYRACI